MNEDPPSSQACLYASPPSSWIISQCTHTEQRGVTNMIQVPQWSFCCGSSSAPVPQAVFYFLFLYWEWWDPCRVSSFVCLSLMSVHSVYIPTDSWCWVETLIQASVQGGLSHIIYSSFTTVWRRNSGPSCGSSVFCNHFALIPCKQLLH